jgi:tRNA threonylcarbamoyladenosine biosynthesis protein TsaB
MRILALETSDKTGSLAAIADDNLLAELILDPTQRSAQSLAPAMQCLLHQVGWQPSDVQLVAISTGPGSFTGLRVGVTAAKVFAYAVGAEVLGVSTLEAIAANAGTVPIFASAKMGLSPSEAQGRNPTPPLSVVIDAQRGEVVVQSYVRRPDGWFEAAGPEELVDADAWLARLQKSVSDVSSLPLEEGSGGMAAENLEFEIQGSESPNPCCPHPKPLPKGEGAIVTGPGRARLLARLPPGVETLEERLWHPHAAIVGRLAVRYYAEGRRDDLWKLVPRYYRRSAAEEKWEARMAQT